MPENDTSTADIDENEKDPDDVELDVTDIVVGTVTTADAPEVNGFAAIGARPETVEALAAVGITTPFAIQTMTLPIALAGHDLIGQSRTGTGKTQGFGVPLNQNVKSKAEGGNGTPQAIVVVPTRELCVQVTSDL
ncbi:MAG: DEAD/DEAH box helicase, partial [Pseudorhodobacter sp.]|nr:DEAD/DEAH box helicase [Frankiaceae bacterium]